MTDGLRFKPWRGDKFEDGIADVRLLIVGESHYSKKTEEKDDPDFTVKIVTNVISGTHKGKLKFFHNIQRLFRSIESGFGPPEIEESRSKFWNRVAFCNFIQEVLKGPGLKPAVQLYKEGLKPFHKLVEQLQPRCVLFGCRRLYMDAIKPHFQRAANLEGTQPRSTVVISSGGSRAVGSYIHHPSYPGYMNGQPWVKALLQRAHSLGDSMGTL